MSSSRQARRERRAAETASLEVGFVSQNHPNAGSAEAPIETGFVSQSEPQPIPPVTEDHLHRRREINRANARHSTGPRSKTGKLASSRNSLQHGLTSGTLIVPGEDPIGFAALKTALFEEHQPVSETETLLVTEMAQCWWLTQRAIRLQNECFTETGLDEKRLALFLRYQTTHERAFHKALNTLIRLKKDRLNAEGGFVSQERPQPASEAGFVSQASPLLRPNDGFVSLNSDEFVPPQAPQGQKQAPHDQKHAA